MHQGEFVGKNELLVREEANSSAAFHSRRRCIDSDTDTSVQSRSGDSAIIKNAAIDNSNHWEQARAGSRMLIM